MRRQYTIGLLIFFLGMGCFQGLGFGSSDSQTYDWQAKLKRGALNIVTSPVEIAREVQITSDEKSLREGWTVGLVKGLGQGVTRFGAGVLDVLTCPFNFPNEQKKPLVEPEYVWQKPGVKYS